MDKSELDRLSLNAIQNALEREVDPARIADLHAELGFQQFSDITIGLIQLGFVDERLLDDVLKNFIKVIELYPNNLRARNHLAALSLIRGDDLSGALSYLDEIPNPIFQCRPEEDRDLYPPVNIESPLKISEQDRQKLNEIMLPSIKQYPISIQLFECERLILRGIALYLSGNAENWEKSIDEAFKDPDREEIFPSILVFPVIHSIKQRLGPESCQDLRAVLNKYYEPSRRRIQRMMEIFEKYRPETDSETSG